MILNKFVIDIPKDVWTYMSRDVLTYLEIKKDVEYFFVNSVIRGNLRKNPNKHVIMEQPHLNSMFNTFINNPAPEIDLMCILEKYVNSEAVVSLLGEVNSYAGDYLVHNWSHTASQVMDLQIEICSVQIVLKTFK